MHAHVQAAQLEVRTQHMSHALQYRTHHDGALKDRALVDQIGQATRARLLFELASRRDALGLEQGRNPRSQLRQHLRAHQAG